MNTIKNFIICTAIALSVMLAFAAFAVWVYDGPQRWRETASWSIVALGFAFAVSIVPAPKPRAARPAPHPTPDPAVFAGIKPAGTQGLEMPPPARKEHAVSMPLPGTGQARSSAHATQPADAIKVEIVASDRFSTMANAKPLLLHPALVHCAENPFRVVGVYIRGDESGTIAVSPAVKEAAAEAAAVTTDAHTPATPAS